MPTRKDALLRIIYLASRLRDMYPGLCEEFHAVRKELGQIRDDQRTPVCPPDPVYVAGVKENFRSLQEVCGKMSQEACELGNLFPEHLPAAMAYKLPVNAHRWEDFDWPKALDSLQRVAELAGEKLERLDQQEADRLAEAEQAERKARPKKSTASGEARETLPEWMSLRDILDVFGLQAKENAVRKRLERKRKKNPEDFREAESMRRNEPRILYRTAAVREWLHNLL